jgi:hypothetical protein
MKNHEIELSARLPRDIGMRVGVLAKRVTPDQVAEMMAVRLFNMHASQCQTHPMHWKGEGVYVSLIQWGIIEPETVPGWPRGWKHARLTELGERVLLSLAEDALVATGKMAPLDPPEWKDVDDVAA